MKHINYNLLPLAAMKLADSNVPYQDTVCGIVEIGPGDELVEAAFASDCDECRVKINIAPTSGKGSDGNKFGVRPEPSYEQKPPLVDKDGNVITREK